MQEKVCSKKRHTKAEIRSEMSDLICGRIAAGENYSLTCDNNGIIRNGEKMKTIVEAVAKYAMEKPKKLCIVDTENSYTYEQIWMLVQTVANKIFNIGIKKEDCVIVECTQNANYLICGLACQLMGAIFVPVGHKVTENNLNQILVETNAQLIVCETKYNLPIKKMSINALCENYLLESFVWETMPKEEATAEILYTTGTTGKSKGIEITNKSNIALAENILYGTHMGENNVELIPLPINHSHGLRTCYANLLNGSTIILVEGATQIKWIYEFIMKYKVTALDLSPSAVHILEKLLGKKFSEFSAQIDYIQIGTAVLPEDLKQMLINNFPKARLYNFYGSTESGRTCILDFNKYQNSKGCIGKPTKNAKFIIVDEKRCPIKSSKDNPGLLASAGKMNMKGYWGEPLLSKGIMENGYIYSNDLGYIDEDGFIFILGRKNEVINCGGLKISPDEIEEIVMKNNKVKDCACVAKPDEILGQVPKLYIVVQNEKAFDIKEFMKDLRKDFEVHKLPKEIKIIEKIPRTYNGKIQRSKLMEKFKDQN